MYATCVVQKAFLYNRIFRTMVNDHTRKEDSADFFSHSAGCM